MLFVPRSPIRRSASVTYHVQRAGELVATMIVSDLVQETMGRKDSFRGAKQRVRGYPAISTSMGSGTAVLVANRFWVEVASQSPAVSDKQRDAWLNAFDYGRLVSLGATHEK